MKEYLLHHETLKSNKTLALFAGLTVLFLLLLILRATAVRLDGLAITFLVFSFVFLFYTVNYRTLIIRITPDTLKLKFGIFTWTVAMNNIQTCTPDDDLPALNKYGGAGIHFIFVNGRYRASWNFLEYSRLVIAFRKKVGPVVDLSFSTRQPGEIQTILQKAITGFQMPG